ncbi:MAG: helix-hairpin-helix domain-containing protein [candidate division KSB1 bacterium]|nr:helix-hairpin-helix domain-containing protein [candidate division KSB1 bacterium]MDZ7367342.1 helix-hairpin-helix domain-containing protein [candidate division KSB1 bacterium]MDZ7405223.1 helix-hairpin-helix domain-containing protein [candidate division KSB1 bacterium]
MMQRTILACVTALSLALALGVVDMSNAQVGKNQGVLNPNLAGEKELLALPHLNAKLVKAILEKRPFLNMTALDTLLRQSLSKEQLAGLYPKLFVPINLNTATREEILLVPGVGRRMAHEFEEYRPYRSLAQFRREIGKYVDEKEVARLEQFVFVPINLNTASDEDILSIPGIGKRMLHEFKEYRPYKNIEQFRREIGKYVDKREVARLESYITLE